MRNGPDDVTIAVLVCTAGGILFALPVRHVLETMRPLAVEPLAGMPDAVAGAAVIRGKIAPVLDARVLLGAAPAGPPGRFVSLAIDGRTVALAVDATLGVRMLDGATLGPLPPLLARTAGASVEAVSVADEKLLLLLRELRIVPDEAWAAIEGHA